MENDEAELPLRGPDECGSLNGTDQPLCGICMNGVEEDEDKIFRTWCSASDFHQQPNSSCHIECVVAMISSQVYTAFQGSCPSIMCPCLHEENKFSVIPYTYWSEHAPKALLLKYSKNAEDLLPFLCGNCHCQKTCLITFQEKLDHHILKTSEYKAFVNHKLSLEEFYNFLMHERNPPEDTAGGGAVNDTEWNYFFPRLQVIADPALRANLQLRYLRDYPTFRTKCCKSPSCFNCKSAEHLGKTCQFNLRLCDNDIIECNKCGISLTKGDGCDSVVCVCRNNISWAHAKKEKQNILGFSKAYPENTSHNCAIVLQDSWSRERKNFTSFFQPSTPVPPPTKRRYAEAYRRRYTSDVNARLLYLWENNYGYHSKHTLQYCTSDMTQKDLKEKDQVDCRSEKEEPLPSRRLVGATTSGLSIRIAERLVPSLHSAKAFVVAMECVPFPLLGITKDKLRKFPLWASREGARFDPATCHPAELWAWGHRGDTIRSYLNVMHVEYIHTLFDAFHKSEDKIEAALHICEDPLGTRPPSERGRTTPFSAFGCDVAKIACKFLQDPQNRHKIKLARGRMNIKAVKQFLFTHGNAAMLPSSSSHNNGMQSSGCKLLRNAIEMIWFSINGSSTGDPLDVKAFMAREYIDSAAELFEAKAGELLRRIDEGDATEADDNVAGSTYTSNEANSLKVVCSPAFRAALTSYAHVVDEQPANPRHALGGASIGSGGRGYPTPPPRYSITGIVSADSLRQAAASLRRTGLLRRGPSWGTAARGLPFASALREAAENLRAPAPRRGEHRRAVRSFAGRVLTPHGTDVRTPLSSPQPSPSSRLHSVFASLPPQNIQEDLNSSRSSSIASDLSSLSTNGRQDEEEEDLFGLEDPLRLSWTDFWCATLWVVRYRSRTSVEAFKKEHGAAAFSIAALLLASDRANKDDRSVAFDFARTYRNQMNDWYSYDQNCTSPLIDVKRGCRCIPRHLKVSSSGGAAGASASHHCPTRTWIRSDIAPPLTEEQQARSLKDEEEFELQHNPHGYGSIAYKTNLWNWLRNQTVPNLAGSLDSGRESRSSVTINLRSEGTHDKGTSTMSRFAHESRDETVRTGSGLTPSFPLGPAVEGSPRARTLGRGPPPPPPPPNNSSRGPPPPPPHSITRRGHVAELTAVFNARAVRVPNRTLLLSELRRGRRLQPVSDRSDN